MYGSDTYLVLLTVENNQVIRYDCDCPYDGGPVCKHIVAALYQLQEIDTLPPELAKTSTKKGKSKNKQNDVEIILDQLSLNQLKEYLKNKMDLDDTLKIHFLNSFSFLNPSATSVEYYTKQIKKILRSAEDSYGYLNWEGANKVVQAINPLFEMSEKYVLIENYKLAININMALLIESMFVPEYSTEMDVDHLPTAAYDNLIEIAALQLSENDRVYLLEFCLENAQKKTFKNYSWHIQFFQLAVDLTNNTKEGEKLLEIIESMQFEDHHKEHVELVQLQIIEKFKPTKEVKQFKLKIRHNASIRKMLIEEALSHKDYETAHNYAIEGAAYELQNNRPGLVSTWVDWQLKIAQQQNNKEEIIRLAKKRLFDNWRSEQDYFLLLKKTVAKKEWTSFLNHLIIEIKNSSNWQTHNLLPKIYIREKMYAPLLEIVKSDPGFHTITMYEKHLIKDYKKEIIDLYEHAIFQFLEDNEGRSKYRKAVSYIQKIKNMGATEVSKSIVSRLKQLYPRRRALLEELSGI